VFRHPLFIGLGLVAAFVALAELALLLAPSAWADVLVPVPMTNIVISLGELPQWVIAVVAATGLWKSWRVEQHMVAVARDMHDVKHETNSMRTALEAAKLAEGKLVGRRELRDELASSDAQTKEVTRAAAISDAETAAKVESIKTAAERPERAETPEDESKV
jgi:hypothetical protein